MERRKETFPKRPLTVVRITEQGKESFKKYITKLKDILDEIETG
ncbi:MAG: transcriptional regulator [Candidatus Odinarchaeota archaeon]